MGMANERRRKNDMAGLVHSRAVESHQGFSESWSLPELPYYPTLLGSLNHFSKFDMASVIHLRSESKAFEHRSARWYSWALHNTNIDTAVVTPKTTKSLLEAGYQVNVEKSSERIFDDSEFEAVGATLVPEGSWVDAPHDHIIVGLKELPEDKCESTSLEVLYIPT